jgi:ribosomal protein S18 acetylase RimI-like enzyme
VTVRRATDADLAVLEELWAAFEREVPAPPYVEVDGAQERAEIREIVESGLAFLAEREQQPVGFALARLTAARNARLTDLYVVPDARRDGVAADLVSAVAEELAGHGVGHLDLEVRSGNADARAVYGRWGFTEQLLVLGVPLPTLRERLAPDRQAASFASLHVQTDAVADVERAVREFAPRIGSRGSRVVGPRNGWLAVYDEVITPTRPRSSGSRASCRPGSERSWWRCRSRPSRSSAWWRSSEAGSWTSTSPCRSSTGRWPRGT